MHAYTRCIEGDLSCLLHIFPSQLLALHSSPFLHLQNIRLLNTMNYFIVKHLTRDK